MRLKSLFRAWMPVSFISTLLSGLIYLTVQQDLRQGANDPQIQIAQDLAEILQNSKNPQDLIGQTQINLAKSLAPFIIIYDEAGKPIASQAVLDGRNPAPPKGVFDYTKTHHEDRVTWEPKKGVRVAAVIEHFEGAHPGFVLVGRSLKEVESRIDNLNKYVVIGWIAAVIGSLVIILLLGV